MSACGNTLLRVWHRWRLSSSLPPELRPFPSPCRNPMERAGDTPMSLTARSC
jgi:hypothetical protein